jgi:hypothetical protein
MTVGAEAVGLSGRAGAYLLWLWTRVWVWTWFGLRVQVWFGLRTWFEFGFGCDLYIWRDLFFRPAPDHILVVTVRVVRVFGLRLVRFLGVWARLEHASDVVSATAGIAHCRSAVGGQVRAGRIHDPAAKHLDIANCVAGGNGVAHVATAIDVPGLERAAIGVGIGMAASAGDSPIVFRPHAAGTQSGQRREQGAKHVPSRWTPRERPGDCVEAVTLHRFASAQRLRDHSTS